MSPSVALDLLTRGGTLGLLALWSILILRDQRDALAGRLAVAMNACIAAFLFNGIWVSGTDWKFARVASDSLSIFAAPLFWLFARAWFDDVARLGWRQWAPVIAIAALYAAQMATLVARGHGSVFLWEALHLAMLGFALAGMWEAWKGRDNDLLETRRRLRLLLVIAIGLFVIAVVALDFVVIAGFAAAQARAVLPPAILLFTLAACAAMFGFGQRNLLAAPSQPQPQEGPPPQAPSPLAARLLALMAAERPYRQDGLTIAQLAAQLNEPEYRLRRLINGELGHRNFSQFLNGYRLDEVRESLRDPTQRAVPILTIALDAGFGSLGPFNRAFRDAEGVTPSEWRQRALGDSGIG